MMALGAIATSTLVEAGNARTLSFCNESGAADDADFG